MKLHSRGAHPPRLDFPPLSEEAWELIRSCWDREASKRPRIEVVMEEMVAIAHDIDSQSRVKRHECAMCHKRLAKLSCSVTLLNLLTGYVLAAGIAWPQALTATYESALKNLFMLQFRPGRILFHLYQAIAHERVQEK
jgi:hypothetical protein